jgi:opacity protein-like surface antigen
MKKIILCSVAAFLMLGSVASLTAAPRNPDNSGLAYMQGSSDLAGWTCGLYVEGWENSLKIGTARTTTDIESEKLMGFVGYDVVRWMTLYLTAGRSSAKFDGSSQDSSAAFGGGVQFNILDVEIPDPRLEQDKLRLNGSLQGTYTSADYRNDNLSWVELYADLTVSLVNDTFGSSFLSPESTTIFVGPFYSSLLTSDFNGPSGNENQIGLTVGGEVFLSKRISFNARYNYAEEKGYVAGVNVRF